MVFGFSEVDDLSNGNPVLTVQYLVSPYKFSAVLLKFLASLCKGNSLISGGGDGDLDWLIVFDIDVVEIRVAALNVLLRG